MSINYTKKVVVIAFCGIDGSGKTTQMKKIEKWLNENNILAKSTKVKFHDLEVIYRICDNEFGDPYAYGKLPPDIVRTGIAFDFAYHYMKLEEELNNVDVLLCDRHKLCFLAYGKAYGVKDFTWIKKIMNIIPDPDLTFYFDTDINVSNNRIKKRKEYAFR